MKSDEVTLNDSHEMRRTRALAASVANADDASIWRWFSPLLEEHRIRWCLAGDRWIISVDNTYAGTDKSFDLAIRLAKQNVEKKQQTPTNIERMVRKVS